MTKKKELITEEYQELTKEPEEIPMYSITLKEKTQDGKYLVMDADQILPTLMFGEGHPMIMARFKDDRARFIPLMNINWFDQNKGVNQDTQMMAQLMKEKKRKETQHLESDASFV